MTLVEIRVSERNEAIVYFIKLETNACFLSLNPEAAYLIRGFPDFLHTQYYLTVTLISVLCICVGNLQLLASGSLPATGNGL